MEKTYKIISRKLRLLAFYRKWIVYYGMQELLHGGYRLGTIN